MRKAFTVLAIFLITISLGIFELVRVRTTLTSMEDIITDLNQRYEINESDITIFYDELGDLKEYRKKQKN